MKKIASVNKVGTAAQVGSFFLALYSVSSEVFHGFEIKGDIIDIPNGNKADKEIPATDFVIKTELVTRTFDKIGGCNGIRVTKIF